MNVFVTAIYFLKFILPSQTISSIPPGCFAGEDEIIILNHGYRKFSDIRDVLNGESILSLSSTNNENKTMCYSKLKSWIHFDPKVSVSFLFLQLEDSHFLHITADHLIYKSGYNDAMNLTRAANVRVGDHLYIKYGDSVQKKKVIKIQQRQALGAYAPLTESRNLFVNDILVSSFTHVENVYLQEIMFQYAGFITYSLDTVIPSLKSPGIAFSLINFLDLSYLFAHCSE